MTPATFLPLLESELLLLGVPFEQGELSVWLSGCWPLVADAPDAGRWAREFMWNKAMT